MKLAIAVVQDRDAPDLISALSEQSFGVTRLASTGGLLREGNTTVLIGFPETRLDELTEIIRSTCHARQQFAAPMAASFPTGSYYIPAPVEITVGGATVFILNTESFIKV